MKVGDDALCDRRTGTTARRPLKIRLYFEQFSLERKELRIHYRDTEDTESFMSLQMAIIRQPDSLTVQG